MKKTSSARLNTCTQNRILSCMHNTHVYSQQDVFITIHQPFYKSKTVTHTHTHICTCDSVHNYYYYYNRIHTTAQRILTKRDKPGVYPVTSKAALPQSSTCSQTTMEYTILPHKPAYHSTYPIPSLLESLFNTFSNFLVNVNVNSHQCTYM